MHKIDHTKGELVTAVSHQWANRPEDQRFLSLSSLRSQVATWAEQSVSQAVAPADIEAVWDVEDPAGLQLLVGGAPLSPTNYAFNQVAKLAGAPASYLSELPGALAGINLNYGLQRAEQKQVAAYLLKSDETAASQIRGITSLKYGRIFDRDVVDVVMGVAGDGVGDTHWKVPGTIDWQSEFGVTYNPEVEITKQNTTLYASDRDMFVFLVDDMHPIEVGKLADGSPDLMFRGFYVWNSEVGQRSFGVATMYLRGVCMNRNLWGVEGFSEVTFRHTSGAPERFSTEAAPMLEQFSDKGTAQLLAGVKAAKAAIVAENGTERVEFLRKLGLSEKASLAVVAVAEIEEGHPPASVWDMAQALSAYARREEHQDARLKLEILAGKILDRVKVD